MPINPSIALRLETERVHLLYKQNIIGVLALLLYSISFAIVCGSSMGQNTLRIWIGFVLASCVLRLIGSWRWRKVRHQLKTLDDIKPWMHLIQAMLVVSGAFWGVAAWYGTHSDDTAIQIFTSLTVVFMSAGALVCWSPSLRTMHLVVLPAMIPWCLSYLLSDKPLFQLMGALSSSFLILGLRVGSMLYRYIENSFQLNIENSLLTDELQQEIKVKDKAEESLRLALSSSNALVWNWNVQDDIFVCNGDMSRLIDQNRSRFSGKLDEFIQLIYPEDQEKLRAMILMLALKGEELDTDIRVQWSDGSLHDLTFRGRAEPGDENKFSYLNGIVWDTTEQKAQARLRQERDIHEAANKAKSVFLSNASHEIRTPLAAINGYVENLLQNGEGSPELKQDLQAIHRNGKFLATLVNDFLDLSKIETGRFYLQKAPMSLKQEIEEVILQSKPSAEAKKIQLELVYESILPLMIESDASRFRQILGNLISNAIKFTPKGKVTVRVHHGIDNKMEGQLSVRVLDTGVGIDDRTKAQLFEPFMRGESVDVQRTYGSGLGLALSKNLARLLGGEIHLAFSAPGMGSEFVFSLDTGAAQALKYPTRTQKGPEKTLPLKGMRLLVVDDAEDLRVLMRRYLEKQGALVDTCTNGLEAVEQAPTKPYDAILMDIKMPVMDGHEATRTLRSQGYRVPIIAITAHASVDDRQKCLDAGCNTYLSKPVDLPFLIETLRHTLAVRPTGPGELRI